MPTLVCAASYRQAIDAAHSYGVARSDVILASRVDKVRGLIGFDVLVVQGFTARRDAQDVWEMVRYRINRDRAESARVVLPVLPPDSTVLYRATLDQADTTVRPRDEGGAMPHRPHDSGELNRRDRRIIDAIAAILPSTPAALRTALRRALRPLRLAAAAIRAAADFAARIPPDPHPRATAAASARNQRATRWYRALYLVNAARRFHTAITRRPRGQSVTDAVRDAARVEARYLRQHLAAQTNRRRTAAQVDRLAAVYGDRLGWYAVGDSSTTADCRRAHHRDFLVSRPPRMGLPGAVHPNCRCRPVRPWGTAPLLT